MAGDAVYHRMPGGGGDVDPWHANHELVPRDVARGYVTAEDVERDYGLVLRGEPPGWTRRRPKAIVLNRAFA